MKEVPSSLPSRAADVQHRRRSPAQLVRTVRKVTDTAVVGSDGHRWDRDRSCGRRCCGSRSWGGPGGPSGPP
jgi:hypothetical protein